MQDLTEELKKLVYDYNAVYSGFLKSSNTQDGSSKGSLQDNTDLFSYYSLRNYSFKIGSVLVSNPIISAPLAGISDNTYRIFARYFGSGLTCSEMISSYGIHFNHAATIKIARVTDYERPVVLQLFGSESDILLDSAQKIENAADIVDINMGCPVPKVLRSKSGGFLLQDEVKVKRIISRITSGIAKPLTIKLRTGWDRNNINVCNIAKIAESCGAAAVSVHGRTVKQGFSGEVDYEIIKKVKESVKIPVTASGDIDSPMKARQILDYTGCDAVMIGRSSKGAPWIFFNILMSLRNSPDLSLYVQNKRKISDDNLEDASFYNDFCPDTDFRKKFAGLYLRFLISFNGEEKGVKEFRKYLSWIFKGTRGINKFKHKFFSVKNFEDVINILNSL